MTERPDDNPKSAFGMTKPPLHLIPSTALVNVSMVMKLGAQKYGAYNWREKSVAATVYVSAAERHLRSWLDGENVDPESGQSHLAHMVACGLILLDATAGGNLIDDRPTAAPTGRLIGELTTKVASEGSPQALAEKAASTERRHADGWCRHGWREITCPICRPPPSKDD